MAKAGNSSRQVVEALSFYPTNQFPGHSKSTEYEGIPTIN